jgi:hypothetical protein
LRQHGARSGDAARPRLIFHHEALAELVAELLRGDARGDVGNAGGAERQHEPHRTARVALLRGGCRRNHGCRGTREADGKLAPGDAVVEHARLSLSYDCWFGADQAQRGAACNRVRIGGERQP